MASAAILHAEVTLEVHTPSRVRPRYLSERLGRGLGGPLTRPTLHGEPSTLQDLANSALCRQLQLWPMMLSGPQWTWVREEDLSHPTMAGYLAYLDLFLASEGLQIDPASFLTPETE